MIEIKLGQSFLNNLLLYDDGPDFNDIAITIAKLGDAAVEQVVLHEDDKGEIVFSRNYLTREMKVAAMYAHLPREKRYEIQQKLLAAFINNPDRNETQTIIRKKVPPTQWVNRYLEIDGRGVAINLPCGFNVLSFYFIEYFDESQLRQFVQIIVSVTEICFSEGTRPYSIWADYVDKACCTDTLTEFQTIDKFLKCVSEKLGRDVVVSELLYHNNGGGKVIARAASTGNLQILQVMSAYLEMDLRLCVTCFVVHWQLLKEFGRETDGIL